MKDGYYLFTYLDVNELRNVMGVSLRHDQNMSLFQKTGSHITLIHHWELERFSGIKHHNIAFFNFEDAKEYINELLEEYDVTIDDMQGVYGTPGLDTEEDYHSIEEFGNVSYHSVSHMFSSLLMDAELFYENDILALAFDGGPDSVIDQKIEEKNYFCGAVSKKGNMEVFPISSPGAYWAYVSNYFHMPEGTLMALAYATEVRSLDEFEELPDYYGSKNKLVVEKKIKKIIDCIMSYEIIDGKCSHCINYDDRYTEKENKISMIMKIIQEASIIKIYNLINDLVDKYQIKPENTILSLSGGYALNCPTNTSVMYKFGFKMQLICPCVNDGGLAIGMGLYYFYKRINRMNFYFKTAFYGSADYSLSQVMAQYKDYVKHFHEGLDMIAEDLIHGPIVWFYGKAEVGPRALGHRSILSSPCSLSYKDKINECKQREWWRPVAPMILADKVDEWFENAFPSGFMLNNFRIIEGKKDRVPAIIHLDNTARIQTISDENDEVMSDIISRFYQVTGIPIICNTSLNDKGEPIINYIEEAFNFALRKKIEIMYVNGIRINLKHHERYKEKKCLQRKNQILKKHITEKAEILRKYNPYGLSERELVLYLLNVNLQKYDITKESDVTILKKVLDKVFKYSIDMGGIDSIIQHKIQ